ncbi:MAG TPA: hypothetical protein VI756_12040 [Blastocatellia bacterium]
MRRSTAVGGLLRTVKSDSRRISDHVQLINVILAAAIVVSVSATAMAQTAPATQGWVVLPVDEYRALHRAAFPNAPEPVPPPVDAALTRIDYDLRIDGDLASGEAQLSLDVVKSGWVEVSIPGGLLVREALLDGHAVSLVTSATDKPAQPGTCVLLSHTGRSVLTLKVVLPISATAGTELLQLPIGESAVSRASIVLPRKGVDVRVSGGLLLDNKESGNDSHWIANANGAGPLTFVWKRRVDDHKASEPLKLRSVITQLVGLGEETTQINSEIQLDVLQGEATEVQVQLPEQFTVNQVAGALVADWNVPSARQLNVTFIEPVQQTTRFTITGDVKLPRDGQIDVSIVRVQAAERETGGVAVEVVGAGEIKDHRTAGLEEVEAGELGQMISSRQSPSLLAFRLRPADGQSTRKLTVNVARYTAQAVLAANVEEARYSVLITRDGKMLVQSRFAVRNNQRSFLKVTLPSTATLWSASVGGRSIRPGRAPDGSILLPLEKTRSGDEAPAFVVEIAYTDKGEVWLDKGHTKLTLLALDLPISKSSVLIHYPPLFRLTAAPGPFRTASYAPPESAVLTTGAPTKDSSPPVLSQSILQNQGQADGSISQALVSRLKENTSSIPARNLPITVAFPHFGPSIYMVAELTGENQTPVLQFDFLRDKKGGDR